MIANLYRVLEPAVRNIQRGYLTPTADGCLRFELTDHGARRISGAPDETFWELAHIVGYAERPQPKLGPEPEFVDTGFGRLTASCGCRISIDRIVHACSAEHRRFIQAKIALMHDSTVLLLQAER